MKAKNDVTCTFCPTKGSQKNFKLMGTTLNAPMYLCEKCMDHFFPKNKGITKTS